jgi:hypothetical protein
VSNAATAFASSSGEAFNLIAVISGNTAIKIRCIKFRTLRYVPRFVAYNQTRMKPDSDRSRGSAGVGDPGYSNFASHLVTTAV